MTQMTDQVEAVFQLLSASMPEGVDGSRIEEIAAAIVTGEGDLTTLWALAARDLREQGVSVLDVVNAMRAA